MRRSIGKEGMAHADDVEVTETEDVVEEVGVAEVDTLLVELVVVVEAEVTDVEDTVIELEEVLLVDVAVLELVVPVGNAPSGPP